MFKKITLSVLVPYCSTVVVIILYSIYYILCKAGTDWAETITTSILPEGPSERMEVDYKPVVGLSDPHGLQTRSRAFRPSWTTNP